jgi:hypothetical protein
VFGGPFKTFKLGNDSKIERGEISLKKSLIAIALLTFGFGLLISPSSFATAPKAGDIPDIRVIAPAGASSLLDLDNYALDYDNYSWIANTNLSWVVTPHALAPVATLNGTNDLSLAATAVAGNAGTYDFVVTDASSQSSTNTSEFVSSTVIGLYPAISQDQLLTPSVTNPGYTYPIDVLGATGATTTALSDDVVASGVGTTWQSVYISRVYDASNNAAYSPRLNIASGVGSATVTGLTASIDAAGHFTLTATAGGLSQPVLVGFKGQNTSSSDYAGVSALVSQALLSVDNYPPTTKEVDPGYNIDDGFETASGRIAQTGFSGAPFLRSFNRLNGPAKNTWVSRVGNAASISGGSYYPSVTVVDDTSLPVGLQGSGLSFAGDHSGKSLCIALASSTTGSNGVTGAYLALNSPVPATAGFAYAVEASVGSSAASAVTAPQVHLAINTFGYTEVAVQELSSSATGVSGPTSAGWIRMRTYIEPTAAGLADGVGQPDGLGVTIMAINDVATAVNVYIDNVRIYRTAMPDDLAWGSAKVAIAGRPDVSVGSRIREFIDTAAPAPLNGAAFYGNFENGSGAVGAPASVTNGNANGWLVQGGTLPSGVTASVAASVAATKIRAGDANWLEVSFNAAAVGATGIIRSRNLKASAGGAAFSPGLYVMSLDYQTPSGASAVPTVLTAITDDNFRTYAYLSTASGTNGAIRRVRVPAALRDLDAIQYLYGFVSSSASISQVCHIDNVQADLINDKTEYNDASLFGL